MTSTYRFSALASSFVRMWRGWRIVIPVILVNAVIQALLIWPPFTYQSGVWTALSAIISAVVLWLSYGLVASSALRVPEGPVRWADVTAAVRTNAVRFLVWGVLWTLAVAIGLALFVIPGVIVIALTPFLGLAVLDGQGHPLHANLRTIRDRFGRWLITVVIVMGVMSIAYYVSGFINFFVRGSVATLIIWLIGGWLLTWFVTAFGLIYRNARVASQ